MTAIRLSAGLAVTLLVALTAQPQEPAAVTLRAVKYNGLAETVAQLRGQVVVVDLWAYFCVPCKQGFPHLVEWHKKYAGQGLAAVSVCLDPPEDRGKAEQFLVKHNAAFTNLWLDEPAQVWVERLRTDSIPCAFVFDRRGRWVQFKDGDPAQIEQLIVKLLAE
jgi:thiol-disulfide isomerase/thioredoxin